ncbi:unnamed protein product [Rotaria sp. Silwood1]|nr:unnamed protein product [Rotaria sp. Silwood1]CAF0844159.1 unnamed protein product [Rotaria sp. Silwood1]CAF3342258.1 unnamed protein product [Rotaria sp. Silwood1]CAF3365410.1 unnamed protein product [Rotaria sp. Silwood1]CAF3432400.1 unnamed protein product [Rotaria sp. Silwood1]
MASWYRREDPFPYETTELIVSGIIPMILIVIGTFGNLISVIILLNQQNRGTSTNIYLIFLCLMDTISLYQWNLKHAVYTITAGRQEVWGGSVLHCQLSQFFAFYTLHTSAMFLTFVQLDRACLLRSRWYKTKIAQPRVALIICAIILLVLFALNGFLFGLGFEYSIYNNTTDNHETFVVCYYSLIPQLNDFFSLHYAWVMKKLIIKQTYTNNQLAISAQRNRRISIMLALMCFTYIITTLPNRLCFSVFGNQIIGHDYADTVFLATNTLMYTRNALNAFFLYVSVYGFRRDVRQLTLTCWKKLTGEDVLQENNGNVGTIMPLRAPARSAITTMPIKKTTH